METYKGTTNGITTENGVISVLDLISNIYGPVDSSKIILDIGSSDGSALDAFKRNSGVNRAIGVEFLKYRFDKSVANYPDCEFHLDSIIDRHDLVSQADIIFTNNISFEKSVFWNIYDSIKTGAVVIYNWTPISIKLRRNYGYDKKTEIHKVMVESNYMMSEYHAIIKK